MGQLLRGSLVELEFLAHDDLEPALPIAHNTIHLFIGASAKKRLGHDDRPV